MAQHVLWATLPAGLRDREPFPFPRDSVFQRAVLLHGLHGDGAPVPCPEPGMAAHRRPAPDELHPLPDRRLVFLPNLPAAVPARCGPFPDGALCEPTGPL